MFKHEPLKQGVFDVVLKIGIAFLETDFFGNTAKGFFEHPPVSAADFSLEDAENSDKDTDNSENNKRGDTNHGFIVTQLGSLSEMSECVG